MDLMANYNALLKVMKQAGANATESKYPVNVCFGKVTSAEPLKILVEQKIPLGEVQLTLTKTVTDEPLNVDDRVVLLRVQGGQKYVVMDKVV